MQAFLTQFQRSQSQNVGGDSEEVADFDKEEEDEEEEEDDNQ